MLYSKIILIVISFFWTIGAWGFGRVSDINTMTHPVKIFAIYTLGLPGVIVEYLTNFYEPTGFIFPSLMDVMVYALIIGITTGICYFILNTLVIWKFKKYGLITTPTSRDYSFKKLLKAALIAGAIIVALTLLPNITFELWGNCRTSPFKAFNPKCQPTGNAIVEPQLTNTPTSPTLTPTPTPLPAIQPHDVTLSNLPYPFDRLDSYVKTNDWRHYNFRTPWSNYSNKPQNEDTVLYLRLPPDFRVSEKVVVDPPVSLVIEHGNSIMYIGDALIFSRGGGLYCLDCQTVGVMMAKILQEVRSIPIAEDNTCSFKPCYITQFDIPENYTPGRSHTVTIITNSLNDFALFLKIAETIRFWPLEYGYSTIENFILAMAKITSILSTTDSRFKPTFTIEEEATHWPTFTHPTGTFSIKYHPNLKAVLLSKNGPQIPATFDVVKFIPVNNSDTETDFHIQILFDSDPRSQGCANSTCYQVTELGNLNPLDVPQPYIGIEPQYHSPMREWLRDHHQNEIMFGLYFGPITNSKYSRGSISGNYYTGNQREVLKQMLATVKIDATKFPPN